MHSAPYLPRNNFCVGLGVLWWGHIARATFHRALLCWNKQSARCPLDLDRFDWGSLGINQDRAGPLDFFLDCHQSFDERFRTRRAADT